MSLTAAAAYLLEHKSTLLSDAAYAVAGASLLVKASESMVSLLLFAFPGLRGVDGELKHVAAWLDKASKWGPLNAVALSPKGDQ